MQKIYNPKQVAQMLGVTRRTVYNYVNGGTLQSVKTPTGLIRISEEALNSFLNEREGVLNSQVSDNLK